MSQISTVTVPCLVIQLNNTIIIHNDQVIGQVLQVPCRNDFQDDPNYWLVPVKDSGIFTTLTPVPAVGQYGDIPPTFDSIPAFRVRDKLSGYTWWCYGTNEDFTASCGTCCGSSAIPMPGADGSIIIKIAPCDTLCIADVNGNYYSVTGLPTLVGSEKYFPYGAYNNVALPAASGAGYSTPAALLVFLNANWTNQGSPNAKFVWTLSADSITLIATGGFFNDSLCVVITTVGASS